MRSHTKSRLPVALLRLSQLAGNHRMGRDDLPNPDAAERKFQRQSEQNRGMDQGYITEPETTLVVMNIGGYYPAEG